MSKPSALQNARSTPWSLIILSLVVAVLTLLASITSLYLNYNRLVYLREQTERMEMELEQDKMQLEQDKQRQWLDIQCDSLQSDFGVTTELAPEERASHSLASEEQ